MSKVEQFSSRWGIIFASLAMAIGAGNLWRFPRLAGQHGGTFIILWILFLILWSIPLLLAEFSIGKKYKQGVIGSYALFAGKKYAWGGFFITLCTLGIAFYYSIVTGWALRYLGLSFTNAYNGVTGGPTINDLLTADPQYMDTVWTGISNGSWLTVLMYICAVLVGAWVLGKGVQKGWEMANKIMIPTLLGLLVLISIISLTIDNGVLGLEYMFTIDFDKFYDPKVWLEALSQSAWSTGAGWGLMMTISSYSRDKEDVTLNTFIGAFGNNTASLLAAMAILPAVFALAASEASAIEYLQAGNQALSFTIIPRLFAIIPGGAWLSILFFLAFFMAAFSSLLPMMELFLRNLTDLGLGRPSAMARVVVFSLVFGFPSAWSLDVFNNQDWVWGVGLIVSGLLIMGGVVKYGAGRFKREFVDVDSDFRVPDWFFKVTMIMNLFVGVFLIYWWMSRGYSSYPWFNENGNWNLFDVYSNASIVTQWGLVIITGIVINGFLYKKFVRK